MVRRAYFAARRLSLVDEAQSGYEERDDRRRLVNLRRKRRGRARLVVVLEKAGRASLVLGVGEQMTAHGAGVLPAQSIVEPLVVCVVETLLLQRPLEIPVRLGHEHEVGVTRADAGDRRRPERLIGWRRAVGGTRAIAPRAREDVRQDEHGHVAANAVTLVPDRLEHLAHRLSQPGVAIVELRRVGPAGEVRVAPVGEPTCAGSRAQPPVVVGLTRQVVVAAMHIELRPLANPRMIERRVVGDEVQHQAQVAFGEPLAKELERAGAAEVTVHDVLADGEWRAGDVVRREVGENLAIFVLPLGLAQRDPSPGLPCLPNAEQPDPVEPVGRDAVEDRVVHVGERGRPVARAPQLVEPDTRVDLVERRVIRHQTPRSETGSRPQRSRNVSASTIPKTLISVATRPVQPVWWLAPSPAPLSPWKYSQHRIRSRQCGSGWHVAALPYTGRAPGPSRTQT